MAITPEHIEFKWAFRLRIYSAIWRTEGTLPTQGLLSLIVQPCRNGERCDVVGRQSKSAGKAFRNLLHPLLMIREQLGFAGNASALLRFGFILPLLHNEPPCFVVGVVPLDR